MIQSIQCRAIGWRSHNSQPIQPGRMAGGTIRSVVVVSWWPALLAAFAVQSGRAQAPAVGIHTCPASCDYPSGLPFCGANVAYRACPGSESFETLDQRALAIVNATATGRYLSTDCLAAATRVACIGLIQPCEFGTDTRSLCETACSQVVAQCGFSPRLCNNSSIVLGQVAEHCVELDYDGELAVARRQGTRSLASMQVRRTGCGLWAWGSTLSFRSWPRVASTYRNGASTCTSTTGFHPTGKASGCAASG
jgi:hypothetical protein